MERTTKILRPPQADDVWYVKIHHPACAAELDTVLVQEMTAETVKLVFIDMPVQNGALPSARYKTSDVVWVEHVRVMPRVVQMPPPTYFYGESELKPCPTNPPEATEPPSAPPSPVRPPHNVRQLGLPPTKK